MVWYDVVWYGMVYTYVVVSKCYGMVLWCEEFNPNALVVFGNSHA